MYNWIRKHNAVLGIVLGAIGAIAAIAALLPEPSTPQAIEIITDSRDQSNTVIDNSRNISMGDLVFSSERRPNDNLQEVSPFAPIPPDEHSSLRFVEVETNTSESFVERHDNVSRSTEQGATRDLPRDRDSGSDGLSAVKNTDEGKSIKSQLIAIAWPHSNANVDGSAEQIDGSAEGEFLGCGQDKGRFVCELSVKNNDPELNQYSVELGETHLSGDGGRASHATFVRTNNSEWSDDPKPARVESGSERVFEIGFDELYDVAKISKLNVAFSSALAPLRFEYDIRVVPYYLASAPAGGVGNPTALSERVVLRTECRKMNRGGCTAAERACHTLPENKYVEGGRVSYGVIVSHFGNNAMCRAPELDGYAERRDSGGSLLTVGATQICANLHVESGSGDSNLGKVFFVSCGYFYNSE